MFEMRPSEAMVKRLDSIRRWAPRDGSGAGEAGVLGCCCGVLCLEDVGVEGDVSWALDLRGVDGHVRWEFTLCRAFFPLFSSALCAFMGDHLRSGVLKPCRKASISQSARSL